MQTTGLLAVLLVAAQAHHPDGALISTPAELLGMAVSAALSGPFATDDDAVVCQKSTLSCANCTHLNQCVYLGGRWTRVRTSPCEDTRPFCLDGACVRELDDDGRCGSPTVSDRFQCYDGFDGYYPSPDDCATYYVCSDGLAYVYNCPPGLIYSHRRAACVLQDKHPDDCYVFPCDPDKLSYQLYRPDPSVYAACVPGSGAHVSRCLADGHRIDPDDPHGVCLPFCAGQGRIADGADPRKYYDCNEVPPDATEPACTRCSQPGALSDPVPHYCPPKWVFNGLLGRCVAPTRP
ncbi:Chitotriosidase-1 [Frankliniella fusca]|uniref:Chitotriosidase-1 n=1 Tax=Frankliniella fusca TaxID=407009 RepID=A0AAE1LAU9_9NEOP|nr:Chitotriosidase-1 [Frankliniella fusca]